MKESLMRLQFPIFLLALFLVMVGQPVAAQPISTFHNWGNWQIYGNSPQFMDFGLGIFDTNDGAIGTGRIELRFGRKLFFIGPAVGILANTDGGIFGYGGIYADIAYKNLVITPLLGAGGYHKGGGKDLGGIFQFRSSITLAYQFHNLSRLGVQFAHVSNAALEHINPGEQDVFLTYAVPF
jgi:lipid A 3-O-deacylase